MDLADMASYLSFHEVRLRSKVLQEILHLQTQLRHFANLRIINQFSKY